MIEFDPMRFEMRIDSRTASEYDLIFVVLQFDLAYACCMTSKLLNKKRYRLLPGERQGGCGKTFLAEDTRDGTLRVVKQFSPSKRNSDWHAKLKDLFIQEAGVLTNLRHPQIPAIHDYFVEDGDFYFVEDWVEGRTLSEAIKTEGAMPESRVRELLASLLCILDYVHSGGLIHRDITLQNIIIRGKDGIPLLIDFGAVKQIMNDPFSEVTLVPSIGIGKKNFCPEEQERGFPLEASDLYSLGWTAIYCLMGEAKEENKVDREQCLSRVGRNLARVLSRATEPSVEDRYKTAKEMLNALEAASAQATRTELDDRSLTLTHHSPLPIGFISPFKKLPISVPATSNALANSITHFLTKLESPLSKKSPVPLPIRRRINSIRQICVDRFSSNLGIDLGTANTVIYLRNRGIVLSEPSVVAVHSQTGRVVAAGREANEVMRQIPNLRLERPVVDGVIVDTKLASGMLRAFIKKAHDGERVGSPRVVIAVPSDSTQVERDAFFNAGYEANTADVWCVEKGMAAAIGVGEPIEAPRGIMIVDVGAGTTEITVISLSGVVHSRSVRIGGNEMNQVISRYIKRAHNLEILDRTAEDIKLEIGSASPVDESLSCEVHGSHLVEDVIKMITVTDEDIRQALADPIGRIVMTIRRAIERTPPELSNDIVERGVVLTGGGALLKNLDKKISLELGLPVRIAGNPYASVAIGAGMLDCRRVMRARREFIKEFRVKTRNMSKTAP